MWKMVKLGEICDVLDSLRKPITKKDRVAGDYPYYGATGIVDWVEDYIFDEKLVLVGEDGAKWGSGDTTAFITTGKYWVNNHAHVLRPMPELVIHEWISYYLTGIDLSEFVTGLTVPKLNQANLRTIPIPLPPLAEQQRIVAKLDAAFAEIDEAIETTKNSKDNALKLYEALSREVFFAGDDVVPLRDIATVIMGQSPNGKSYNADGVGTPLVNGPVEFEEGSFGRSKSIKFTTQPTKFCKSGDALLCVRGSTTGRMNLASVDACIGRGVAAIRAHNNQQWINYFLQSARGYIFSIGTGATFPNVSSKQIESIEIRNPNQEEKRELIDKLSECYENIQVINKTYDLKKSNLVILKSAILAQELQREVA